MSRKRNYTITGDGYCTYCHSTKEGVHGSGCMFNVKNMPSDQQPVVLGFDKSKSCEDASVVTEYISLIAFDKILDEMISQQDKQMRMAEANGNDVVRVAAYQKISGMRDAKYLAHRLNVKLK